MDVQIKSPNEKIPVFFNFTNDLLAGETIVNISDFTSINTATGESSFDDRAYDPGPPEVLEIVKIIDSFEIQTPDVKLVLKDGVEGDEHQIQCVVTTSLGNVLQRDLYLRIQTVVDENFSKQPDDQFLFAVNFTNRLTESDTLASSSATATLESTGASATSTVIHAVYSITPKTGIYVKAGTDGETYLLVILGTTSAGYIHQKTVRMNVQEI